VPAVEARVALRLAESGGFHGPKPTGARSLMLVFSSLEDPAGEMKIGSVIEVIGGPALVPGTVEVLVIVRFWADEAAVYATPRVALTLW
jgi:hypothetical protein